jgi:hypothetical protein
VPFHAATVISHLHLFIVLSHAVPVPHKVMFPPALQLPPLLYMSLISVLEGWVFAPVLSHLHLFIVVLLSHAVPVSHRYMSPPALQSPSLYLVLISALVGCRAAASVKKKTQYLQQHFISNWLPFYMCINKKVTFYFLNIAIPNLHMKCFLSNQYTSSLCSPGIDPSAATSDSLNVPPHVPCLF